MIMMMNRKLVEEDKANISVLDHGFLYGAGVFETFRTYNHHPFLIEDHMERLIRACETIRIKISLSLSEWEEQIQKLLEVNNLKDAIFRITVTGGKKGMGLIDTTYNNPNVLIFVRPISKEKSRENSLQLVDTLRQAPGGGERLKTNSFLNNVLARQEIMDYPATEGLFLTKEGYLAEGVTSNLFFGIGNSLYTPSMELGILPGITRSFVIEVARCLGYNVYKGLYSVEMLRNAEEIFVTNSVSEIIPIHMFEGREFKNYSIINHLIAEYQKYTTYLRSVGEYIGGKYR